MAARRPSPLPPRIAASRHRGIAISQGSLAGFGQGIMLVTSPHASVADVRSTNVSGVSVAVGRHAYLARNSVGGLIQAECPSVLTENLTEGFVTVLVTGGAPLLQCVRWNNRSLIFTDAVTQ